MTFILDLFKPLLTILVTAIGLAFIASILSPEVDHWMDSRLSAWRLLQPAEDAVREWLGLHPETEPSWWHFWGRD